MFNHQDKDPGDLILSADWNASMNEVARLETDKVNRQGEDTITGPLTIEQALTVNSPVGIGTSNPQAQLEVTGLGGTHIDLLVNGRLKSNSDDGGLWVADNKFVGGTGSSEIGFYNGDWKLTVNNNSVEVKSALTVTGAIMPSFGNSESAGIHFPSGLGRASGDSAWIRYYSHGGRRSTLEIGIADDRNDHIALIPNTGNVGIGTTEPKAKLEVTGLGGTHIDLLVNGRLKSNSDDGGLWVSSDRFIGGFGNSVGFWNGGSWKLAVTSAGNVGIGTTSPTKGKVQIEGHTKYTKPEGYEFWKRGGKGSTEKNGWNAPYSLYANKFIGAQEFNAWSDLRIKEVEGSSNSRADLETLLKIDITDYTYKDKLTKGNKPQKKVIGQQIAEVFPQAVGTHTDVVPDVLQFAPIDNGWIDLPNHGLAAGERVKIFSKIDDKAIYTVESATEDRFQVSTDYEDQVFVYGHEVDDFHVVDYDAISMLNVSATQELYKIIEKLQAEVTTLKAQLNGTSAHQPPVPSK